MTAVGLVCRALTERKTGRDDVTPKQAELLLRNPPRWDVEGLGIDEYYWCHATLALHRVGEPYWGKLRSALHCLALSGDARPVRARRCAPQGAVSG